MNLLRVRENLREFHLVAVNSKGGRARNSRKLTIPLATAGELLFVTTFQRRCLLCQRDRKNMEKRKKGCIIYNSA